MIYINGELFDIKHFPDGTPLIKGLKKYLYDPDVTLTWLYDNEMELSYIMYIAKYLSDKRAGYSVHLNMPYIPNARQDRVKDMDDVFTLKIFAQFINSLNFHSVTVFDPHSSVSEALFNNLVIERPDV